MQQTNENTGEGIKTLAELAAQLPPNLSADWRDTNHLGIIYLTPADKSAIF